MTNHHKAYTQINRKYPATRSLNTETKCCGLTRCGAMFIAVLRSLTASKTVKILLFPNNEDRREQV